MNTALCPVWQRHHCKCRTVFFIAFRVGFCKEPTTGNRFQNADEVAILRVFLAMFGSCVVSGGPGEREMSGFADERRTEHRKNDGGSEEYRPDDRRRLGFSADCCGGLQGTHAVERVDARRSVMAAPRKHSPDAGAQVKGTDSAEGVDAKEPRRQEPVVPHRAARPQRKGECRKRCRQRHCGDEAVAATKSNPDRNEHQDHKYRRLRGAVGRGMQRCGMREKGEQRAKRTGVSLVIHRVRVRQIVGERHRPKSRQHARNHAHRGDVSKLALPLRSSEFEQAACNGEEDRKNGWNDVAQADAGQQGHRAGSATSSAEESNQAPHVEDREKEAE